MASNTIYRYLTASIFFAAFFTQTFNNVFVIADYYTNTGKYAKNCENKDKPMMHCNGKCQMMKKLQEERKKDQENPERRSDNKNEITLFSRSFAPALPAICDLEIKTKTGIHSSSCKSIDRAFDIFHPPQA